MSWSAIWGNLKDFGLYLPVSLWFNFRHLPFKQACRLPILIGASRISTCRGRVRIESDRIRPGMIRLGRKCTGIFPRQRFLWENRGSVVFKGECMIGSNSSVCVGEKGTLILGENFAASASLKLICYHHVSFGTNTLIGWDCIFCDTDFHRTKSVADGAGPAATAHASFGNRQRPGKRTCPAVAVNGHEREKEVGGVTGLLSTCYKQIAIGDNNWFAMKCIVLKGARTPNRCIVGAGAVLTKDCSSLPEHCLLAGNPASLKKTGVYLDRSDDQINYSSYEP